MPCECNKKQKNKNQKKRCIFPGYNWCGPGCSGPDAPINEVDACCKAHDDCYKIDSICKCDREFINCLRSKIDLTSKKGIIAAKMYFYMRIQIIFTCFNKN